MGGVVIFMLPLFALYVESRMKYTGARENEFIEPVRPGLAHAR